MKPRINGFFIIFIGFLTVNVQVDAWDAEDFEVFDLVEEIGIQKNFYEILGVTSDATQNTIRKAYHRLSLQLHPDHNKDENAENIFRQLVAVYEVLKDNAKRKKYNQVLTDGLPDWRQPIYYYRRVRKFGLLELGIILFGILTLGQYIVAWSVYFERKYEVEEVIGSKFKKINKKYKKARDGEDPLKSKIQEIVCLIPKPRCLDLLPFVILRCIVCSALSLPNLFIALGGHIAKSFARRQTPTVDSDHSENEVDDEVSNEKVTKSRRRRAFEIPEFQQQANPITKTNGKTENEDESEEEIVYENRTWFDDDIALLTRAMVKYPVGTNKRWNVIADLLQRSRQDVISMAKTVNKLSAGTKPVSDRIQGLSIGRSANLESVRDNEERDQRNEGDCLWSSTQQKALETALLTFPKGVEDRWDRIGECVPDKTKEECIVRYKYLVELVKKRRKNDDR